MTRVVTGCLPGGSSSMTYSARSPCSHSASVRGMGVAVMYMTCGGGVAFAASLALCSTPNLNRRFFSVQGCISLVCCRELTD